MAEGPSARLRALAALVGLGRLGRGDPSESALLAGLVDAAREVSRGRSPSAVAECAATSARALGRADRVRVYACDGAGGPELELLADTAGGTPAPTIGPSPAVLSAAGVPSPGHGGGPVVDAAASWAIPILSGGAVVGVLELCGATAAGVGATTSAAIELLASHAGAALDAVRLHRGADRLSRTDPLTRLPNRGALAAELRAEWERARRYGRPLAFLMVDVDRFKRVNDRHGHVVGDQVLCEVAQLLADNVRATDTVYRYGGEEFCVLARDSGLAAGAELAERLRLAVERRGGRRARGGLVTISAGVATVEMAMAAPEALVSLADGALYLAKRAGRNRVVVAPAAELRGVPVGRFPPRPTGSAGDEAIVLTLPGFEDTRVGEPPPS